MVIIVPLLQPSDDNGAPLFGVTFLQSLNQATDIDSDVKDALISEFVGIMKYDGVSYASSQPDIIFLEMKPSSLSDPLVLVNNFARLES